MQSAREENLNARYAIIFCIDRERHQMSSQSSYSLKPGPGDICLFPKLTGNLKRSHFDDINIKEFEIRIQHNFTFDVLNGAFTKKLKYQNCSDIRRSYFEGDKSFVLIRNSYISLLKKVSDFPECLSHVDRRKNNVCTYFTHKNLMAELKKGEQHGQR